MIEHWNGSLAGGDFTSFILGTTALG